MNSPNLTLSGNYAVFGATGNLGRPITEQLLLQGANVHAIARHKENLEQLEKNDRLHTHSIEIQNRHPFRLTTDLKKLPPLDSLVYCLGHYPANGFDKEVSQPLSVSKGALLARDLQVHVTRLDLLYRELLNISLLKQEAHLVVIGSAITRLTENECPPWLHAWHYTVATAAKEALVRGMRHDPATKKLNLRIHYLAFGAVDTPFHHGCEHQPPKMLSIERVVDEVMCALHSDTHVHKHILAQ